jgi:hypothetical protein
MNNSIPDDLIIEEIGAHNSNLAETSARLIKGGTWKRQRMIIIVPAGEMINSKVALSHWNLMFPPNNGVFRILAEGLEVGDAYSRSIEQVLAHPELQNWEYILTIEHDNLPPGDGVIRLLESMENHPEFACISGLYFTKGPGGVAQIWGDIKDPMLNYRPQIPKDGELIECYGTGMGFALWRLSMFKDEKIAKPWFRTKSSLQEGSGTQDLVFWSEARKHGYRCAVDCSVKVGHMDCEGKFGLKGKVW